MEALLRRYSLATVRQVSGRTSPYWSTPVHRFVTACYHCAGTEAGLGVVGGTPVLEPGPVESEGSDDGDDDGFPVVPVAAAAGGVVVLAAIGVALGLFFVARRRRAAATAGAAAGKPYEMPPGPTMNGYNPPPAYVATHDGFASQPTGSSVPGGYQPGAPPPGGFPGPPPGGFAAPPTGGSMPSHMADGYQPGAPPPGGFAAPPTGGSMPSHMADGYQPGAPPPGGFAAPPTGGSMPSHMANGYQPGAPPPPQNIPEGGFTYSQPAPYGGSYGSAPPPPPQYAGSYAASAAPPM